MANQKIIDQYVSICSSNLEKNPKLIAILKKQGIYEHFIFENFRIGFSDGNIHKLIGDNEELLVAFKSIGIIKGDKEIFKNYFTIPILDENKSIVNIVGYNLFPQTKNREIYLNEEGIFNSSFL